MAKLLHCDVCGERMAEDDVCVVANFFEKSVFLRVQEFVSQNHGWRQQDVCQSCKRHIVADILVMPGVRF